jgi:hypothetical protein
MFAKSNPCDIILGAGKSHRLAASHGTNFESDGVFRDMPQGL